MYVNDVLLCEMCGEMTLGGAGTGKVSFAKGTTLAGVTSFGPLVQAVTSAGATFPFSVVAMYVLTATDITNGLLFVAPQVSAVTTSVTMFVQSLRFTVRRP
jgi:hypothetical protein